MLLSQTTSDHVLSWTGLQIGSLDCFWGSIWTSMQAHEHLSKSDFRLGILMHLRNTVWASSQQPGLAILIYGMICTSSVHALTCLVTHGYVTKLNAHMDIGIGRLAWCTPNLQFRLHNTAHASHVKAKENSVVVLRMLGSLRTPEMPMQRPRSRLTTVDGQWDDFAFLDITCQRPSHKLWEDQEDWRRDVWGCL